MADAERHYIVIEVRGTVARMSGLRRSIHDYATLTDLPIADFSVRTDKDRVTHGIDHPEWSKYIAAMFALMRRRTKYRGTWR